MNSLLKLVSVAQRPIIAEIHNKNEQQSLVLMINLARLPLVETIKQEFCQINC